MQRLKPFFLITDIGFIVYWLITALSLIPAVWLFKEYHNPIMVAWNWSFMPLDLFISSTGLTSLWLHHRHDPRWQAMALISLVLTFCSGLMALVFFTLRNDYDPAWWFANGYLMIYPLFFLPGMIRTIAAPSPAHEPLRSEPAA
ncbi:MAG: YvaD family protein [Roseiflexaceae bacterium]